METFLCLRSKMAINSESWSTKVSAYLRLGKKWQDHISIEHGFGKPPIVNLQLQIQEKSANLLHRCGIRGLVVVSTNAKEKNLLMLRASWLTLPSASHPTARLQNIVYIYCNEEARSFLSGEVLIYLFLFHHQVVLQATLGFTPICNPHSFARGKLRSQNVCFGFCITSKDFLTLEIGNPSLKMFHFSQYSAIHSDLIS